MRRSRRDIIARIIKMNTFESYTPPKMLRLPQVKEYTGLSRSTIYDLMNPNSPSYDPSFPMQVELTHSTVGWVEGEVYAWIESRIQKRTQRSTDASLKEKSKKSRIQLTSNNKSQ